MISFTNTVEKGIDELAKKSKWQYGDHGIIDNKENQLILSSSFSRTISGVQISDEESHFGNISDINTFCTLFFPIKDLYYLVDDYSFYYK